jgi:ribosomal protein L14E/L6E/L27E
MFDTEIKCGTVVFCKAGREKGRFLVVVDSDDSFVYLADGKERKLTSPKKKNIKHIALTNTILDIAEITDKGLRQTLSRFGVQED